MKFFSIDSINDLEVFKKNCLKERYAIMISSERILITDISNKLLYDYKEGNSKVSKVKNSEDEILEKILCSLLKKSDRVIYSSQPNLLATLGISYQLYRHTKTDNEYELWENNKDFMFKVLKNDFHIYYELNNLKKLFNYI